MDGSGHAFHIGPGRQHGAETMERERDDELGENRTDAAALGGGVVAIAMTMFAEEGPYDPVGLVVAVTLALLIFGYVGGHPRKSVPQSLAFGAVVGIVSIPVWGFLAETWKAWPWTGTHEKAVYVAWHALHDETHNPILESIGEPSTVSDWATCVAWAIVTLLVAGADRPRGRALLRNAWSAVNPNSP
jgi:hypothetical protein